jgi:hypothetical protein
VRARNGGQLHRLEHDRVASGWNAYGTLKARRAGPVELAELLIDCEEDRTLRALLVGMLREAERSGLRRN